MASSKHPLPKIEEPDSKRPKLSSTTPDSQLSKTISRQVELNRADCNLDFDVEGSGLQGHALQKDGFAYCWSGARANVGITGGKYCFGCKVISAQPVIMEDTPLDQQHVCRVGISRGDDNVGNLGESEHSFGFGGTGKFSNSGKFSDYGTKFGVGDTIVCAVNLENKPFAVIGFSKNGKWLGTAKEFDAGPRGLGVVNSPVRKLQWESALFPHILLKNVVVQVQFSVEDGLVPEEGYRPWSSALEDGNVITGPTFSNPKDCEVLMMVGLPASGKTTWAEKWVKEHPEKRYLLLGTNLALDQMKVPGLTRKQNYGERFDRLMDRATGIFNTLLARAAKTPRNYILDQTNVYKSARKRKLKAFVNYRKIAVVIFPRPDELKRRAEKRFKEMGKEVPAEAVNEMLANYVLPMSKDMPGADEFFDQVMFPELNRAESERYLNEMKCALGPSNLNNRDFSPYSRENSIQSFTSPLPQNAGAVSAGGHWRNSHSPLTPPDYGFHHPQLVTPSYSGAGVYGKPEIYSGGFRSGSGDPNLSVPRDSPYGNYSNYDHSLTKNEPDSYGSYGGQDPYDRRNFESRIAIPGGGTDLSRSYGGNDPYSRSSFEGRHSTPVADNDPYRSYGRNDHYGTPNLERPTSFGRPNFESPRSSFSYCSPGAHVGDLKLPRADPRSPMGPPLEPHSPFTTSYGSPYGVPPPRPSPGNFPSTERWHSEGYPPPGPRYY
ncbi:uncharacterized protein LOC131236612 isoform X2 [Magnolia sinica]|uniref:uncharacterized protein LOC131236612 isoform X2 n=1 Tax=Magnolia sinica TaxID=86752 RepID=UPI00265B450A|nr:uncharacterized protein LOC131236612 isoform X2 [Magnolia sinica]